MIRSPLRLAAVLAAVLATSLSARAAGRRPPDPSLLPECHDAEPFANTRLNVSIAAGPSDGRAWHLPVSTGAVAARFLQLLNENSRGITFVPAAGPTADYAIAVAVDESTGDARKDVVDPKADVRAALASTAPVVTVIESTGAAKTVTAAAIVTSPRRDPTLRLIVPPPPDVFTEWDDAVDRASGDVLALFAHGWHAGVPCRRPDGTVKRK